jgi:hypothetical protein
MRTLLLVAIPALPLLMCAGCGSGKISLPGDAPVYTISCDNDPGDCYAGAQTLCGGAYEAAGGERRGEDGRAGNFGWVGTDGSQLEAGSGGGRYSIRIRCK